MALSNYYLELIYGSGFLLGSLSALWFGRFTIRGVLGYVTTIAVLLYVMQSAAEIAGSGIVFPMGAGC